MNLIHLQYDCRGKPSWLSVNGARLIGRVNMVEIRDTAENLLAMQLRVSDCKYTTGKDAHPSPWPWLQKFKREIGRPS